MASRRLTFLSLFSGCGGFDLGFKAAGFECLSAFVIDEDAIDVHKRNLKEPAEVCDLTQSLPSKSIFKGVDILVAGPPCQGFSTIGKRKVDDPRNFLLTIPAKAAASLSPKVVVVENVMGATSGTHRRYWEKLKQMLLKQGYRISETVCNACQHGVPQERRRILLIAWKTKHDIRLELPFTDGGVIGDVLRNLRGLPNHSPSLLLRGTIEAKIAERIKPGQKLCNVRASDRSVHTWDLPKIFGPTSKKEQIVLQKIMQLRRQNRKRTFGDADPVSAKDVEKCAGFGIVRILRSLEKKGFIRRIGKYFDLTNTFNGKYRRLRLDQPAPTVDTRFGHARYFLHPIENRGFTVREAARIQGFPDDFIFSGSVQSQFRLIGNAVPPPLAEQIAVFIRDKILRI